LRVRAGMTMAAAEGWAATRVSRVAVSSGRAIAGTSDSPVATRVIVTKRRGSPTSRARTTPTIVATSVHHGKADSGMAWPSTSRLTSAARAAAARAVVTTEAAIPAAAAVDRRLRNWLVDEEEVDEEEVDISVSLIATPGAS